MVNINNLFSGVMTFFATAGFIYLIHPEVVSMTTQMPSAIRIFILIAWLAFEIMLVIGFPFLMVTSASTDVP